MYLRYAPYIVIVNRLNSSAFNFETNHSGVFEARSFVRSLNFCLFKYLWRSPAMIRDPINKISRTKEAYKLIWFRYLTVTLLPSKAFTDHA